jgi:2-hydroxymuconate-semialdehyde hydrolase
LGNAQITTTKVAVGDVEFQLNEAGDRSNPSVLFLHGSGPGATGLSNWQAVLEDMGDDFHCLAPDVIGFGDSTHPDPSPAGNRAFTELRIHTIIGLLDALKLDTVSLVGNSMGGMWSLGVTGKAPERVDKLVLMGSGGAPVPPGPQIENLRTFYDDPTTEAMTALLAAFVYDPAMFGDRLQEIAEARIPRAVRPDVERSHRATFDMSDRWQFSEADAAAIEHEVLVIHGREDRFVTFDAGRWFFDHLPNARLYGIGKCGHWTQIEQHGRFTAAVRGFLTGAL